MTANETMNDAHGARRLRQILVLLLVILTVEGMIRKAAPSSFGVAIFLCKDALVALMAWYVLRMPRSPGLAFFWQAYVVVAVLFLPLIIFTAADDPLLAVFGAKEYLLFPFVGFAVFLAFQNTSREVFFRFFRYAALLVIPTALLALLQLRLPHDHWLNMSVGGESLEAFSAAGQLRVSSSFPFVAQYCAFLNAETFIVAIALTRWRECNLIWKILLFSLIPLLVISSFVTGSRGAVAGNTAIILLAFGFALMQFRVRYIIQICVVVVVLVAAVQLLNIYYPDTTAAYSNRENGRLIGISANIQQRVYGSFFDVGRDKSLKTLFGNGLGVMSNGSATFSHYAAKWRFYMWTETDLSSVLFEGGYYLAIIWYGFRFCVILATTYLFWREIKDDYFIPAAVTQGFVITIGSTGTLGTQPPIAIWWWFGVGAALVLWWKSITETPEMETKKEEPPPPPPPPKIPRGRSAYADALHSRR